MSKNIDFEVLNSIACRAHYLANKMIYMANDRDDVEKGDPKIGGHSAASSSALHILGGLDHLLFLLMILSLAALNIFRLPSTVVEPGIAASIVLMFRVNLYCMRKTGLGQSNEKLTISRVVLVFAFGLLHGLGFATGIGAIAHRPMQTGSLEVGTRASALKSYNSKRSHRRAFRRWRHRAAMASCCRSSMWTGTPAGETGNSKETH